MIDPTAPPIDIVVEPGALPNPETNAKALELVKKWSLWAMAPGVLPIPILDLAAVAGIQMKMLSEMAELYGTRFSADKVRHVSAALLGSFGTGFVGRTLAVSLLKSVPVVGQAAGALALPAIAAASTYALGRVFAVHFASGGTFLSFDPEKVRDHFQSLYKENLEEHLKKNHDAREAAKQQATN
jgi:uncharacterized protein (DUF697 family)